jgi:hypothetical protein
MLLRFCSVVMLKQWHSREMIGFNIEFVSLDKTSKSAAKLVSGTEQLICDLKHQLLM